MQNQDPPHLLSILEVRVVGVGRHGGEELDEAVQRVTVARWEEIDQQLGGTQLFLGLQHWRGTQREHMSGFILRV